MSKVVGWLLMFGGLFGAACLFWATVFDGPADTWQGRALWGTLGIGALIVSAIGGAVLDSEDGE